MLAHWAGPATGKVSGLSVYLPQNADATDPAYRQVAGGSLWSQFLSDLHGRTSGLTVPAAFPDPDANAVRPRGDGTFDAVAAFDPQVRGLVMSGSVRLGALLDDGSDAISPGTGARGAATAGTGSAGSSPGSGRSG